jgi:cysteine desulfurase/selenocysteine lyase
MKNKFPIFKNKKDLIYFDSAATSLKPKTVIDGVNMYYTKLGANIHRGIYKESYEATLLYEQAKCKVAEFINAKDNEIIFTKGTTSALNAISYMLENDLNENDEIIVSILEHNSSLLPWYRVSKNKKTILKFVNILNFDIDIDHLIASINPKTKILCLNYVSNVFGYQTSVKKIIDIAHQHNIKVIIDAAQAVSHFAIDVVDLDCDFLAFSGHKMFSPTGVGVLFVKETILKDLVPYEWGGDMIEDIDRENVVFKEIPERFEAGTPPIAQVIGLSYAIDFIKDIGFEFIENKIEKLTKYLLLKLSKIKEVIIYNESLRIIPYGIIIFNLRIIKNAKEYFDIHPHDAATFYDTYNICVRAGHHCVHQVSKTLSPNGTIRVSLHIYNDKKEIDKFIEVTKEIINFYKRIYE